MHVYASAKKVILYIKLIITVMTQAFGVVLIIYIQKHLHGIYKIKKIMPKFNKYSKNDESTKLYVLPSKGSPPTSGNVLAINVNPNSLIALFPNDNLPLRIELILDNTILSLLYKYDTIIIKDAIKIGNTNAM